MAGKKLTLLESSLAIVFVSTRQQGEKDQVAKWIGLLHSSYFFIAIIFCGCGITTGSKNTTAKPVAIHPTTTQEKNSTLTKESSRLSQIRLQSQEDYLSGSGIDPHAFDGRDTTSLPELDGSTLSENTLQYSSPVLTKTIGQPDSEVAKKDRISNAIIYIAEPLSGADYNSDDPGRNSHGPSSLTSKIDRSSDTKEKTEAIASCVIQNRTNSISESPAKNAAIQEISTGNSQQVLPSKQHGTIKNVKNNQRPFFVSELVNRTLNSHPEVTSIQLEIQAARARVPQMEALPDPTFNNTFWPVQQQSLQTAAGRVGNQMSFNQKMPWPEKRKMQVSLAKKEIQIKLSELNRVKSEYTKAVKLACYDLWLSDQTLGILRTTRKGLVDLLPIVEARVRSGGLQSDLLRARIAIDKIDQRISLAEQKQGIARSKISEFSGVSVTDLQVGIEIDVPEPFQEELTYLHAKADETNPEILELNWQRQRSKDQVQLADLQRYPDLQFGLHWGLVSNDQQVLSGVANGRDMVSFNVGTTLPIWQSKNRSAVKEARSIESSLLSKIGSQRGAVFNEVRSLYVSIQSLKQRRQLYAEGILPKTLEMLKLGIADYRGQRIGFDDLTTLYLERLQIETEMLRTDAEIATSVAKLERVIGSLQVDRADEE